MNKNKILIALLLFCGTLCYAQDGMNYLDETNTCDTNTPTYYAASETSIYQSAKTNSAIVIKVPRGEMVQVINSDGILNPEMWYICYKGKSGYAQRRLLSYDKITTDSSSPDTQVREEEPEKRKPISDGIADLFDSRISAIVGGGLEKRAVDGPSIQNFSQEQGKVVIRICVNSNGRVISADYTQRGSTTSSRNLIALAKKNAMQYTFTAGDPDKQCGTMAYNFHVSDYNDTNTQSGDLFGRGFVEGLGALSRTRISSPPISDLMKKVGRIVVKVCINKRGAVVYAEYDAENSTLKDIGHKQRAVEYVQKIVFERKNSAPDKECGRLTFRMTPNGFEQE